MEELGFNLQSGDKKNSDTVMAKAYQNLDSFKTGLKIALQGIKNKRPINIVFEQEFGKAVKANNPIKNVLILSLSAADHIPSLLDSVQKVKTLNYQGSGDKIGTTIVNLSEDLIDYGINVLPITLLKDDSDESFATYTHWAHDPYVFDKAEERAERLEHNLDCIFNDEFDIEEY